MEKEEKEEKEIKEENSEEEIEEPDKEDEENSEEEVQEIDEEKEYRESRLNQILANPWKEVSLEGRGEVVSPSLEMNFESQKKEEFEETPAIDYMKKPDEEDSLKYHSASSVGVSQDELMSEAEKNLEEQKRLYGSGIKDHAEARGKDFSSKRKFITEEDTLKKDYLSKVKFG